MHTFSVLSLQLKKLRGHNKSAIDLSNVNPSCGHKEVRRSTGHIMVTTRYSDQQLCGSSSNGTDQYQNGLSNLLPPYREQPRSTRNVAAYPRTSVLSKKPEKLRPNHFDQQVQVSQGDQLHRNKKIEIPRSMVVEALSW